MFQLTHDHENNPVSGIWHWILNFTGTHIPSTGSQWYNFWSGFGSDIGEVVIIGGVWSLYRKHNCHVKGCWRIGKHAVDGTPYIVCATHHPDVPTKGVTAEQMATMGKAHS